MKSLDSEQPFYAFSPKLNPLLTVSQGEEFILTTNDCYNGQLEKNTDTMDCMDWDKTNPATGPVYIEGIKAGDLIRIEIRKIKLIGNSVMATIPGSGRVRGIDEAETVIMHNSTESLYVPTAAGELSIPLRPMIGVIGVAPQEGSISNGIPGAHGGNMDCRLIGENTILYLRANTDGALLGCGDVHAIMGDGEVVVCGAETPAEITLRIEKAEDQNLPTPFFANNVVYAVIASAKTLEEACQAAIDNMFAFLWDHTRLTRGDVGRLMSLVGNLAICQVVDPEFSVRFEFPKVVFDQVKA